MPSPDSLTLPSTIVFAALACLPACSGFDESSGDDGEYGSSGGGQDSDSGSDTGGLTDMDSTAAETEGDGDGEPTDPNLGDCSSVDCGAGTCVMIDDAPYCDCPADTSWAALGCDPCPIIDPADAHDIGLQVVDFTGQYLLAGAPAPGIEYDDANIWLENRRTGDRVFVGNTHDGSFAVRVTPGVYDVVYEVESPGQTMPRNPRITIEQVALFNSQQRDIDIPVAQVSGVAVLDGGPVPQVEYDDANLLLRDSVTGSEVLLGNTHEVEYAVFVVPTTYDLIYRAESLGEQMPHNDGAVLREDILVQPGSYQLNAEITAVPLTGSFTINTAPAPADPYNDANITLSSATGGSVRVGNTHDGSFDVPVIPGTYDLVYEHESGLAVPQNRRARFDQLQVMGGSPQTIDISMVALGGELTLNGAIPPANEFDDGVLELHGVDSDDVVPLGNTHDGSYLVNVIPGTYDVYYSLETAGGNVPENKQARVRSELEILVDEEVGIDVEAVAISGSLTFAGDQPPSSVYDDGRLYLRNAATGDSLLLGSTHGGSYAAVVVPGDYELVYTQEAGAEVPGNQNAVLGPVSVASAMTHDIDVPVVDLAGQITVNGAPAPDVTSDNGQLLLRTPEGDSVLLGDTSAQGYAAKLVAGTYGVFYRAEASDTTMPDNANGRVACFSVE